MFGPLGFWTMAPLRYAAKFDPFLSLDLPSGNLGLEIMVDSRILWPMTTESESVTMTAWMIRVEYWMDWVWRMRSQPFPKA